MDTSIHIPTIAYTTPLGIDRDRDIFNETLEYITIIGIIMYLAHNSYPTIAYTVHQYA